MATTKAQSFVCFAVGMVRYAVPIAHVKEVCRPLAVVAVPRAPSAVLGVADYRGELAVVLDLRRYFTSESDAARPLSKARWLVLDLVGLTLALVVDEVFGVTRSTPEQLRHMPSGAEGVFQRDVVAAFPHEGELVFLLDVESFHDLGQRVRRMAGVTQP